MSFARKTSNKRVKDDDDDVVPLSTPMSELIRQIDIAMKRAGKIPTHVPKWVCTPTYLRSILNGRRPNLNPGMTAKLCTWLQIDPETTARLNELAILSLEPDWWSQFKGGMNKEFWLFLQRQDACDEVCSYDFTFMPSLVQHPVFYEALFKIRQLWPDPVQDYEQSIKLRTERQERWFESGRPMSVIIGEPALHVNLGDGVMKKQGEHLIELSRLPGISIRVAKLSGPWHDIIGSEFDILKYNSRTDEVVIRASDKQDTRYVSPHGQGGKFFIQGFQQAEQVSVSIEEYLNND